jgi:hypothetical protein
MISAAVLAPGCGIGGIDGVELQGGLFDMLGVSGDAQARKGEPKVAARSGLVLPPVADRLPEPGPEPAQLAEAWPDDDDGRRVRAAAELDRQQAEFCEQAKLKDRASGGSGAPAEGPKGPCTPSILRAITGAQSQ